MKGENALSRRRCRGTPPRLARADLYRETLSDERRATLTRAILKRDFCRFHGGKTGGKRDARKPTAD